MDRPDYKAFVKSFDTPLQHSLTSENVTAPKEKVYFGIALTISILVWVLFTLCTMGMVWIFLLIGGILAWLSNGLLIASLKSDAVSVHPNQVGLLDATFREVCATLQLREVPDLYIIQSGGFLNAFATRHSARHFVVVYSSMLESLGPNSAEMKFLLGHEIGHVRKNHLMKKLFLAPALFLPLIGAAYSRSCETTCDRHGALAANDLSAAMRAMMILAGGKEAGKEMDVEHFGEQNKRHRGFFVSWYELISGYPTLCRRVQDLRELETGKHQTSPSRNPLAYLFALFTFGGGFGGRGSLVSTLLVIYMLAIFAGLALPAINGALKKGKEAQRQRQQMQQVHP